MVSEYKYTLQKYAGQRSRHECPNCGKAKQFTLYIDADGQPVAPHVGKCNRVEKCGYHYPPAQYFADNPQIGDGEAWRQSDAWKTPYQPPASKPTDYLPAEALEATQRHYNRNNFVRYLVELFGREKALELAQLYKLGTSKRWRNAGGLAVVFWQIDKEGNVRQAKVMAYNPTTGRRLKDDDKAERMGKDGKYFQDIGKGSKVAFLGKSLAGKDANLQQCFFGEHLLSQESKKPVCLVESEKTAVIMAGIQPAAVWIATGGKNGARWTERAVYQALEGRTVTVYPDLGAYEDWRERAKILATVCEARTSDLLERKATGEDRQAGFDIADYFTGSPSADLPPGWSQDETGEVYDSEGLTLDWYMDMSDERLQMEGLTVRRLVNEARQRLGYAPL